MNLDKTKAMVCTPEFIWGVWGDLAYKQKAAGKGATFIERKKKIISYNVCSVLVSDSYLKKQMEISNGICVPRTRGVDEIQEGTFTYLVSFSRVLQEVNFPVPGCPRVAHIAGRLCEHFMYRHFRSKVTVVQEGTEPMTCCDLCGMHMTAGWLPRHRRTARCNKKQPYEVAEVGCGNCVQMFGGNVQSNRGGGGGTHQGGRGVQIYRAAVGMVKNYWPEVLHNIRKACQVWGKIGKFLQR